jgi:hypothetical protein
MRVNVPESQYCVLRLFQLQFVVPALAGLTRQIESVDCANQPARRLKAVLLTKSESKYRVLLLLLTSARCRVRYSTIALMPALICLALLSSAFDSVVRPSF